jgi:hypothetical protein
MFRQPCGARIAAVEQNRRGTASKHLPLRDFATAPRDVAR